MILATKLIRSTAEWPAVAMAHTVYKENVIRFPSVCRCCKSALHAMRTYLHHKYLCSVISRLPLSEPGCMTVGKVLEM